MHDDAESMALWEWLENHVDPAHRALTPEIAEAASYMAYTEGLLGGTTSVLDMWRHMEGSARAAEQIGIRATLAPYTADLYDYFESLSTNRRRLETRRVAADGRVRTWVGLEHIFYCSPQMFRDAAALAEEFDTGIHTHSSESIWEVQECLKQFGRRPIEEFYQRGILGPQTVIAHSVWLDEREVKLLAETGTSVAHCPCSNMKLASGPARIGHYRRAGERGLTVRRGVVPSASVFGVRNMEPGAGTRQRWPTRPKAHAAAWFPGSPARSSSHHDGQQSNSC